MIAEDSKAKIRRLAMAEGWKVGTIAAQLGLHHETVTRVLEDTTLPGLPKARSVMRHSMIDPYVDFITETLKKYPTLRASRLYEMVRGRGYPGQPDHFRHLIARYRPRRAAQAYLRLSTLPGEQAQVDWAHFGEMSFGKARRKLVAFVMVLSWSRRIFLRFYLGQHMENFLRGHVDAFADFDGVPRVLLYDNLKSAVLERDGNAIRFHPEILAFSAHYCFEARPVAVARGNEKGRVERAIRYIRDSFFAGREYSSLDDLNEQALQWCRGIASDRQCPQDASMTVRTAWESERERLLERPDNVYPVEEHVPVKVGKTPYARFDLNDYSVPHTYVQKTVTAIATLKTVRFLDGTELIAMHGRSYGRGEQIENPEHIEELVRRKREAREHRGLNRLGHAIPESITFLKQVGERGGNIGRTTQGLSEVLEQYGVNELAMAITEVLQHGTPNLHAVRLVLERRRQERQAPAPFVMTLPSDPRVRDSVVRPHELSGYDRINANAKKDEVNGLE